MSSKQEIIANIYYDKEGFGSKAITLKDARAKDKTITMQDVEEFFRKNVEIKRKQRGHHSFVAPHNNHTYQLDLFLISSEEEVLSLRASKDGKPTLVDISRFLTLQVGPASGGRFRKDDIISNIVDKLIEQLPDTSAA